VEKQKEAVVANRLSGVVDLPQGIAVEEHGERSRVIFLPVLFGHLEAVGAEPGDVRDDGAAHRAALEPPSPPEDRMCGLEMDEPPGELQEAVIDGLPVEPRG